MFNTKTITLTLKKLKTMYYALVINIKSTNDIKIELEYHICKIKQTKCWKVRTPSDYSPVYARLIPLIIFLISSICRAWSAICRSRSSSLGRWTTNGGTGDDNPDGNKDGWWWQHSRDNDTPPLSLGQFFFLFCLLYSLCWSLMSLKTLGKLPFLQRI